MGKLCTCWRAALCISRLGSQACPPGAPGADPGLRPLQSFLPSSAYLVLPEARTPSQKPTVLRVFRFPPVALLSTESGLMHRTIFFFKLSSVAFQINSYTLQEKAHINTGEGADLGGAAGTMCLGAPRDPPGPALASGDGPFQMWLVLCSPPPQNGGSVWAQRSGQRRQP